METKTAPPATQVIVTSHPEYCKVHGWIHGNIYPTAFQLIDGYKDENGQNIYVQSLTRNTPVWLSPGNYQLITSKS